MTDFEQPIAPAAQPLKDRSAAEALGFRCMSVSEYARHCADEALLRQLEDGGLL